MNALTDPTDSAQVRQILQRISNNVEKVVIGQGPAIRKVLAAMVAGGHVLLEDNPGTGKTTLSKALAQSVGARFRRIQFTPDLLPSDILGVSVFNPKEQTFHFHPGPVFTDFLLGDEINRASPRTQSALLEAMAEGQVTVEGSSYPLGEHFFVLATQNPVEFRGTYPLPEAQMDRFAMRLSLGYPSPEAEVAILTAQAQGSPLDALEPCASLDDLTQLKRALRAVRVKDDLKRYAVDLVRATRSDARILLPAGPRASLSLLHLAQGLALVDGESFIRPEHVRELAPVVLPHRLVLAPEARFGGASAAGIVQEILERVPVPV